MTLSFLKFNNYYNRIVKRKEAYTEYLQDGTEIATITNCAFIENDGISTQQVVNSYFELGIPDYMVTRDGDAVSSRWFVIECIKLREGQYRVHLYRDVIAEWLNDIVTAPMFIEKATLRSNNPLIFNKENSTFNQILTSQDVLKDNTDCAWAVGYVANTAFAENKEIIANTNISSEGADFTTDSLATFFARYGITFNTGSTISNVAYPYFSSSSKFVVNWHYSLGNGINTQRQTNVSTNGTLLSGASISDSTIGNLVYVIGAPALSRPFSGEAMTNVEFKICDGLINDTTIRQNILAKAVGRTLGFNILDKATTNNLRSLAQKTVYDSASQIKYRIKLMIQTQLYDNKVNLTRGTTLYNAVKSGTIFNLGTTDFEVNNSLYRAQATDTDSNFAIHYREYPLYVELVQDVVETKATIGPNRLHLEDSPYDMFCIPYGEITVKSGGVTKIAKTASNAALSMATKIASESGGSVYDIQLLPYCPAQYAVTTTKGVIDVGQTPVDYIKVGETDVSVVLWCAQSTFNLEIPYSIPIESDNIEKKVKSQCDVYRLCSPNSNGIFEFNPQMNDGVETIKVYCTYKPFTPYIHLKPNFGNLYGYDPDRDSRGLICGGDFSLAQTTNAWATYELNNKNYQNIFDRGIENLEVSQDAERTMQNWNILGNIVSSASGGAIAGGAGGPVGAIAGGVIGGLGSIAGGVADYKISETLRNEALDYRQDLFGYQLGNIKARPDSLAKTSVLVYSNKIFPFIEYYTCTDTEKTAFRNKIKYNGMSVGAIGTMEQYMTDEISYIKGKLIRLNVAEDFHVVNTIADELNKGVFI